MNKLLLLTTFYFFTLTASSQQPFAPAGAVWHYDLSNISSGGFIKIEAMNDTMIQGITCRKLKLGQYLWLLIGPGQIGFQYTELNPKFVYQNADTVFWYTNNLFRELYNYNAQQGNSWVVTDSFAFGMGTGSCDSLSVIPVDSTGTENISGENLRYLSIHPGIGSPLGFWGRIYERIGTTEFLFPEYANCDTGIIVDGTFFNLHCYQDNSFSLYNLDTTDCEWYWTLNIDKPGNQENIFSVYPNPAKDYISIDSQVPASSLTVFNSFGQEVFGQNLNGWLKGFKIETESFSEGIYFLKLETDSGPVTKSFLKQ
jgi:hypothetical protein